MDIDRDVYPLSMENTSIDSTIRRTIHGFQLRKTHCHLPESMALVKRVIMSDMSWTALTRTQASDVCPWDRQDYETA